MKGFGTRTKSRGGWWCAAVVAGLVTLASAGGTGLAQSPSEDAVEAGRRALSSRGSYPWYDSEKDAIRRIDVVPPKEPASHRNSTWQAGPPRQVRLSRLGWLGQWLKALLRGAVWIGIAAVLGLVIFLLVRAFLNSRAAPAAPEERAAASEARGDQDLIESLPFRVKRPAKDFLAEAKRLYGEGKYGEAVLYLFSYQLVQLDKHHLVRLARGKTNRQYLWEIGARARLREIFERTMIAFEDVFFGHHDLDRVRFESCWSRLDEFQELLEQAAI